MMTAGLLTGLGRGLQQAGETYGKFKMYDIEQQRKDDLLERKWGHEDDVREDEQLAELNRAKVNAKSKVDKAVIEAEIKRFKYKNEIIGVDDNNQPITRQQLMKGYDGPVHAMSKKDSGSTSGTDINRVLKAGKEAFGDKFSLDGWNPGGKPSEGKIKTFNRILEANNMPPVSVQTDVGKDEGLFWFDKEKWKFVPNKPEAQIPQGGSGGGLLTSEPDKYKGVAQSRIQPGTGDISNAERPSLKDIYKPNTEQEGSLQMNDFNIPTNFKFDRQRPAAGSGNVSPREAMPVEDAQKPMNVSNKVQVNRPAVQEQTPVRNISNRVQVDRPVTKDTLLSELNNAGAKINPQELKLILRDFQTRYPGKSEDELLKIIRSQFFKS